MLEIVLLCPQTKDNTFYHQKEAKKPQNIHIYEAGIRQFWLIVWLSEKLLINFNSWQLI